MSLGHIVGAHRSGFSVAFAEFHRRSPSAFGYPVAAQCGFLVSLRAFKANAKAAAHWGAAAPAFVERVR
jgi:hypothetical protein